MEQKSQKFGECVWVYVDRLTSYKFYNGELVVV
jgi:hypothetical protein